MSYTSERVDAIREFRETVHRDGAFGGEDRWLILDACGQIEALPPDRHVSARSLVDGILCILDRPKYVGKLWEPELLYKELLLRVLLAGDQLSADMNRSIRETASNDVRQGRDMTASRVVRDKDAGHGGVYIAVGSVADGISE